MSRLLCIETVVILPLNKQLLFEKIGCVGTTFFQQPRAKIYLGK